MKRRARGLRRKERWRYTSSPGQAAIVTEIYLPQKWALSPTFLQALTDSLKPGKVASHFRNTPRADILPLLPGELGSHFQELKNRFSTPGRHLEGYTVASVSGAFRDSERGGAIYDANAVVRIIDFPNHEKMFRGSPPDRQLFQRVVRTIFGWRRHGPARSDTLRTADDLNNWPPFQTLSIPDFESMDDSPCDTREAIRIYKRMKKWIDEESFLLYGFVLYHLTKATGYEEKEIWLTSYFAVVHQFQRAKVRRRKAR